MHAEVREHMLLQEEKLHTSPSLANKIEDEHRKVRGLTYAYR